MRRRAEGRRRRAPPAPARATPNGGPPEVPASPRGVYSKTMRIRTISLSRSPSPRSSRRSPSSRRPRSPRPPPPSRRSSRSTSASATAARRRWRTTPSTTTASTPTCSPTPRRSSCTTPTAPTGRAPGTPSTPTPPTTRREARRLGAVHHRTRTAPSIQLMPLSYRARHCIGMNWKSFGIEFVPGEQRGQGRPLDGPADPRPHQAGQRRHQAGALAQGPLRHQERRRRGSRHRQRLAVLQGPHRDQERRRRLVRAGGQGLPLAALAAAAAYRLRTSPIRA